MKARNKKMVFNLLAVMVGMVWPVGLVLFLAL